MDIATATDTFIDHFINPHYLSDHEPESMVLSCNEIPSDARQGGDGDGGGDDDFHHLPFSEAGLSEADSASLLSDAITTPLLQDHAASAAIVSALTEEIISVPNTDGSTIIKAAVASGASLSLDFIYHILFYDLDQLLTDSYYPLLPSQHRTPQRTIATEPSLATGDSNNNKRRRDQPPPSPAPFDMDAILCAQQEFIRKRQIEEAQAERNGEKVLASLPKRCRKRMTSHPHA